MNIQVIKDVPLTIMPTNNSLFTYTFEENSGIISLRVTPVSGSISVRFVRTALKA